MRRLAFLFCLSSLVFLAVYAVAPLRGYFREWRGYQKRYNRLAEEKVRQNIPVRTVPVGIRQIWNGMDVSIAVPPSGRGRFCATLLFALTRSPPRSARSAVQCVTADRERRLRCVVRMAACGGGKIPCFLVSTWRPLADNAITATQLQRPGF
jgi:hypothetical protein